MNMMKIDFRRLQHYVYNGNGVQSDKDLIDNHKINYFSLWQKFQFGIKKHYITPLHDYRSAYDASGLSIWRAHISVRICLHDDVIKWKHFRVTGPLCGEFTRHRWIPLTKASGAELWCFLSSINKRLSKQSWGWWFERPSFSLWRHCKV